MDAWFVIGMIVIGGCLLYTGYMLRMVQEVWEKSINEAPPVLDFSEELPSPQQLEFERVEALRQRLWSEEWRA